MCICSKHDQSSNFIVSILYCISQDSFVYSGFLTNSKEFGILPSKLFDCGCLDTGLVHYFQSQCTYSACHPFGSMGIRVCVPDNTTANWIKNSEVTNHKGDVFLSCLKASCCRIIFAIFSNPVHPSM